jgi:hypothetical protein
MLRAHGPVAVLLVVTTVGCGRDLTMPPDPNDTAMAPAIDSITPASALITPATSFCIRGRNLSGVTEVRVGEFTIRGDGLKPVGENLEVHLTAESVEAAYPDGALGGMDGVRRTVQVRSADGEAVSSLGLRVFRGVSEIESVAPRATAAGDVVYLRGNGFDAETLANNAVVLMRDASAVLSFQSEMSALGDQSAAVGADALAAMLAQSAQSGERDLALAQTLWATPTTLAVLIPPATPAGRIEFQYLNLGFKGLESAGRCPAADQTSESGTTDLGDDVGDGIDFRAGAIAEDQKSLFVWRRLGVLVARPSRVIPGRVEIDAANGDRLCYRELTEAGTERLASKLRVLLDGVDLNPVVPQASDLPTAECDLQRPDQLRLLRVPAGRHLLQIANPFSLSPTVTFDVP